MHKEIQWGLWQTIAWMGVIWFLFAVGQILPLYLYALFQDATVSKSILRHYLDIADKDALLLSLIAIGSTLFVVPFVLLIAKLKRGTSLKRYFAFKLFSKKEFWFWLMIAIVILLVQDFVLPLLGVNEMPDFMLNITYPTESSKWLMVLGVAIMVPVLEELIFRGFLLRGLAYSAMGPYAAIVVTSLLWSIVHFQYEWVYLLVIFLIGFVLGYARLKTHSIYIPIMMHVFLNFSAAIELYIKKGIL